MRNTLTILIGCEHLKKNCQYGTLEDDLLLDKIICSIKDTALRERLWMDRNITLDQSIGKYKTKELSQQQLRNIEESHDKVKKNLEDPRQE
jgi:hypothetical protein